LPKRVLALTGANWRQLALTDDHCRGAEVPKCAIAELQWVRFAKTREAVAPGCMGLHPVASGCMALHWVAFRLVPSPLAGAGTVWS